jgi:hypothetical protein
LADEGERLLKEHTPKPVDPFAFVGPPPPSTSTPPAGARQSEGGKPRADTDAGFPALLSASDLAKLIKRNPKSVTSFLTRFACKYPDCRSENPTKRKNEPAYLYRTADVWPALQEWVKDGTEN